MFLFCRTPLDTADNTPSRIGILRSPLPLRSFLMWLAF